MTRNHAIIRNIQKYFTKLRVYKEDCNLLLIVQLHEYNQQFLLLREVDRLRFFYAAKSNQAFLKHDWTHKFALTFHNSENILKINNLVLQSLSLAVQSQLG